MPPLITLGSSAIERTYSYKYLGVSFSSDLSWSDHIHNICTRARRTIGLLYRHFYLNSNPTSLQKLYLTLVRPLLEYACQVWHPHLVRDIAKLKRVQKLALRLCTKQWTLDYSTLLSLCNLPSLETRRKYFCLCTMYKINRFSFRHFCPTGHFYFIEHQTNYSISLSLTPMHLCTHMFPVHVTYGTRFPCLYVQLIQFPCLNHC